MYYIYELIDSSTGKCFYIGKGKGDRMYRHVKKIKNGKSTGNIHLDNKLKKLIQNNIEIIYNKLFETGDEKEAYLKETEIIRLVGLDNLCNLNHGGIGGIEPSEETRKKISEANKGTIQTEEHKKKMVETRRNNDSYHHTEEWKQKQSELKKGKSQTDKQREANLKRSISLSKPKSEEAKKTLSISMLSQYKNGREKYWEGKKHSEETKIKISESVKKKMKQLKEEKIRKAQQDE